MRLPFRRRPVAATDELTVVPDAHPKSGLYTEPVRVASLHVPDPEARGSGQWRASFLLTIKDVADRRCSDVYVQARLTGPERTATAEGTTDLMGQIRFRMQGPAGRYRLEVLNVAAGGLDWDATAGPSTAEQVVQAHAQA